MKRIFVMLGAFALLGVGQAFAADSIVTSVFEDSDDNGQVDQVTITFDEGITCAGGGANGWSIDTAGTINISSINSVTCDGSADVVLAVTADANKTGGATDPVLSYSDAGGDLAGAGQITDKAAVTLSDEASPILTAVTLSPNGGSVGANGTITLAFTATEPMESTPTVYMEDDDS